MSNSSRRFLIGLGGAIVLSFVIAAVAILAYNAGRTAAGADQATAPTVVISADGDSLTIEAAGPTRAAEESAQDATPQESQPEGAQTTEAPAETEQAL